MIKTLTIRDTISHMHDTLVSDGVFTIERYLSGDILQELHDDILGKCQSKASHYEFGRNYRGDALRTFPDDSIISHVYNEDWMRKLHEQYSGNARGYGKNVYATHDYKFTGELARNGWLHFDRDWCLKFFIYLTDIDESCGAFSCSVGSRQQGKSLRQEAWNNTNSYDKVKNRIEIDYPTLFTEYPAEPVEASAGTLVVFDTNTFHKGGCVAEGKERLVVRLHCGK